MTEQHTRIIEVGNDLSEVARVQDELSSIWESRALPAAIELDVSLALEEVLSNVLRHSKIDGLSRDIRVTFEIDDSGFEFEVSDSAAAYDPLSRPEPDVDLPLDQRQAGGLGIYLVRRLGDKVSYQRADGRNR